MLARSAAPQPRHESRDPIDHSSVIYVMGPDGRFIAPLAEAAPKQIAADIAKLMS
jgi:cytochrome oxidase Cu insertion factor (SCO1/SenC/PrrC family)